VRSTAGSLFHLPVFSEQSLRDAINICRENGLQILAADGHSDIELPNISLNMPTAWLFGNEAWGLPEKDRELADHIVKIPMRGRAESLNLATAATVCLYQSSHSVG